MVCDVCFAEIGPDTDFPHVVWTHGRSHCGQRCAGLNISRFKREGVAPDVPDAPDTASGKQPTLEACARNHVRILWDAKDADECPLCAQRQHDGFGLE